MARLLHILGFLGTLAIVSGCYGELSISDDGEDGPVYVGISDDDGEETPDQPSGPAFAIEKENLALLPYEVRMDKLGSVLGRTTDDPVFAELENSKFEIGAHDFANGIQPDLTWTAGKLAIWVRGLTDVCESDAMRERYPYLPEHLNELAVAAYGREVAAADLAVYEDVLADMSLDEPTKYRTVCLAILSSAEFVAR